MTRPHLSRVSWREWVGVSAAALAVVSSFLTWTVLSTDNPSMAGGLAGLAYDSTHRDAWSSGIYAWIPVLLTVLVGIVVGTFGQFRGVRQAGLPQLWSIAAIVAIALLGIGFFAANLQFGTNASALLAETGVQVRAGTGRWLGLAAAVLSLVAATLDVRAARSAR